MSGDAIDIGRIVPSTRDLFGALATRRKTLSLIPLIEHPEVAKEATRLAAIDVRALGIPEAGPDLQTAATSTKATPMLCLNAASSVPALQRARYFGADGIVISARDAAEWEKLSKAAQSMRMVALARATDANTSEACAAWGARALLLDGDMDVARVAHQLPKTILVAHAATVDTLRTYAGVANAALVSQAIHGEDHFEALLDELDG